MSAIGSIWVSCWLFGWRLLFRSKDISTGSSCADLKSCTTRNPNTQAIIRNGRSLRSATPSILKPRAEVVTSRREGESHTSLWGIDMYSRNARCIEEQFSSLVRYGGREGVVFKVETIFKASICGGWPSVGRVDGVFRLCRSDINTDWPLVAII